MIMNPGESARNNPGQSSHRDRRPTRGSLGSLRPGPITIPGSSAKHKFFFLFAFSIFGRRLVLPSIAPGFSCFWEYLRSSVARMIGVMVVK